MFGQQTVSQIFFLSSSDLIFFIFVRKARKAAKENLKLLVDSKRIKVFFAFEILSAAI